MRNTSTSIKDNARWYSHAYTAGLLAMAGIFLVQLPAHAGPLHDVINSRDESALENLIAAGANIEESDYFVGTPLHVAVSVGAPSFVSALLGHGADIEAPSELRGARALALAAEFDDVTILALLLDNGANIEAQDNDGKTPLFVAAEKGNVATLKLLLEAGAKVDHIETGFGMTPLQWASDNGRLEIVKHLLAAGADVNAVDNRGYSALWQAAGSASFTNVGDGRLLELLVAAGADLYLRNDFRQTPREYAETRNGWAWEGVSRALKKLEESNL